MQHWLFKSEPGTYSFDQLLKDKKTNWNGVRNFQARNHLRNAAPGDLAIIYLSGDGRAAVGIAQVVKVAYPDLDPEKPGDWVQIDLAPVGALPRPVTLAEMKATPALKDLQLIKQSRLSCMPVTEAEFMRICQLGGRKA